MALFQLIMVVLLAVAMMNPSDPQRLQTQLNKKAKAAEVGLAGSQYLDENFGYKFTKRPQTVSLVFDCKAFAVAGARRSASGSGSVASYWFGAGGVWFPFPHYGKGPEASLKYFADKNLVKDVKRRWRKLNAADALSGSIIAMLVVWALLSRCGMDEAAYENFTAGSLTNIMWRPWTLFLSGVSHPPEGILVALTHITLLREVALPLQKKLGLNAVLLAFFACNAGAALFNAAYARLAGKQARLGGSTCATVGMLLLFEALLPGQKQLYFFSFGPLTPLHMAGALMLFNGVTNKFQTLPGFVGAAAVAFALTQSTLAQSTDLLELLFARFDLAFTRVQNILF